MNKKVDSEFDGIKDFYVLQCMCTNMKEQILSLRKEIDNLKGKNQVLDVCNVALIDYINNRIDK